jgi:hypothetical protein
MADSKITALTSIGTITDPAVDPLVVVDVSDTSMAATGTTKKVTLNQLLATSPTATLASATITGDLTVRTTRLTTTTTGVGIGTASPTSDLDIFRPSGSGITSGISLRTAAGAGGDGSFIKWLGASSNEKVAQIDGVLNGTDVGYLSFQCGNGADAMAEQYRIASAGIFTWYDGAGGTRMTLNSTGLGIGMAPLASSKLSLFGGTGDTSAADTISSLSRTSSTGNVLGVKLVLTAKDTDYGNLVFRIKSTASSAESSAYYTNALTIDGQNGNVGIGVVPSAWGAGFKAAQVGSRLVLTTTGSDTFFGNNFYNDGAYKFINADYATYYDQTTGKHVWGTSTTSGAVNGVITWNPAMTLDASGNLLVGTTSGTSHNLRKQGTTVEGDTHLNVGNAEHLFFACSSVTYNAAAAAYKITRNSSTLRSINAGGTINASGADYAEYMVKCGDFVLAKGDVAGIDANGKLTNVFADAVSFVVKSTDPSYVGNDKWGVDLEGDDLEAARQLVDRIAFAGQVPVNVLGAKAGDYIIPVVDGTGIKGIAVSKPTFDQYQLAVGKVIAIDADGRARIIVKVA